MANAVEAPTRNNAHAAGRVPLHAAYLDSNRCFDSIKYQDILRLAARLRCAQRAMRLLTELASASGEVHCYQRVGDGPSLSIARTTARLSALCHSACVLWSLSWNSRVAQIMRQFPAILWQVTKLHPRIGDDYWLLEQNNASPAGPWTSIWTRYAGAGCYGMRTGLQLFTHGTAVRDGRLRNWRHLLKAATAKQWALRAEFY